MLIRVSTAIANNISFSATLLYYLQIILLHNRFLS